MHLRTYFAIAIGAAMCTAQAADPQQIWEQAVKAKGGRERLHRVRSLAVYMKPSPVNLPGPPTTWLCAFPDRYFEFDGRGSGEYPYDTLQGRGMAGNPRVIVVNGATDRVAMDANGTPRVVWPITAVERDRLRLNQVMYLLESAWLQPHPVAVKGRNLTVEAGTRTFQISLNAASLPERVVALKQPGERHWDKYEYQLDHYREIQGILLPARVKFIGGVREWIWDVDYDVDATYNPKFFDRMPDLANGPEPWRQR